MTYKVGLSSEKFNQGGSFIEVDCINFPMFRLRSKQEKETYL